MSAKDLLDKIQIKTPCEADWDAMIGNDRIRFCEHCNLTVRDASQLSRKQVLRLVTRSNGRLCLRYQRLPDGSLVTKAVSQKLFQITRRTSRIAAGAFSAALSISSAVANPSNERFDLNESSVATASQDPSRQVYQAGSIGGTITDPNGAVIAGATISLVNAHTELTLFTNSNANGEYRFEGLQPGLYRLRVESQGFDPSSQGSLYLSANDTLQADRRLEVTSIREEMVDGQRPRSNDFTVDGVGENSVGERFVAMGGVALRQPSEPLVKAAQDDDLNEVLTLLSKTNVNVRDGASGATALEYAVRNGNREMVLALLSAGADIKSRNESKETLLMMLGEDATSDLVWDLIHGGVKVDLKDEDGDTALIQAAMVKNLDVLTVLLHAGAKVDAKNDNGQTALMLAAGDNLVKNIKALVAAGADINARDKEGKTALNYAKEGSHEKSIKLLQSYGAIEGDEIAK